MSALQLFRWPHCTFAAAVLALSPDLSAQDALDPIPRHAFQSDHIGVKAMQDGCPWFRVDPTRAPTIRRTGESQDAGGGRVYSYEVTYHTEDTGLCFSPPPPLDSEHIIDVGPLPLGTNRFSIHGLHPDGSVLFEYERAIGVSMYNHVRSDVTGIWYAHEQNGRGVTAMMQADGQVLLYWATHDADGAPAWVFLPPTRATDQQVAGTAITTHGDPLAAGAATLEATSWGQVAFTYDRCARATLTWDAIDPAIGDGSLALEQVAVPAASRYPCLAEDDPLALQAIWLDD